MRLAEILRAPQPVYESAEEFVMQVWAKIKNHGEFTAAEVKRIAPIVTALELMTNEDHGGTHEAMMSKFKGDEQENIDLISRNISKLSAPSSRVGQSLTRVVSSIGASRVAEITAMLNDPDSRDRKQFTADLQKLASWFQQHPGRLEKTQPIPILAPK